MLPSNHKTSTITINIFTPIIQGEGYIESIDDKINSYTHTIAVDGGFVQATIQIAVNENNIEDWIVNGLGRHIEAYGVGGEIIWEGFVDNISINMGSISISIGRLTEVCNRCSVMYTPIFTDDDGNINDPPVTGSPTETIIVEDLESQRKYGIWEQVISGGTRLQEDAESMRDTYLGDHKNPQVTHTIPVGEESGGEVTITLDCKGYIAWLSYVYNYEVEDVSTELSTKITTVLADDPNDIISTDYVNIDYNAYLISKYESENRTAKAIIDEIIGIGDVFYNRWFFGIYENRKAFYKSFPTEIEYLYYVSQRAQKVYNLSESEIPPWNVRPGKLVFLPDTFLGSVMPKTATRDDLRIMFLEQVVFTAPQTIELQGKKIIKFDQLMAQLGLSGG